MLRILNEFFFKKLTFLKRLNRRQSERIANVARERHAKSEQCGAFLERLNRRQSGGLPTWRGMGACFNTRTPERLVITDKTVRMLSVKFT